MKTVTLCRCESCGSLIENEMNGFIIQGNIYVANPIRRGRLDW